jgi:hypothetical protein
VRTRRLNGTFAVRAVVDGGTVVQCIVPLPD